ncbi:UNVERIFIED_CONTAM: hypothetical protein RMT77_007523 [Armadillidium vulgare]
MIIVFKEIEILPYFYYQIFYTWIILKFSIGDVILSSLNYDVKISSRLSETTLRANFINKEEALENCTLQLLIPEEVLLTSFLIESSGKFFASSIVRRGKNKREKVKNIDNNLIKLNRRMGRAQKLEVHTLLKAGEKFVIHLRYSHILKRKRGLYHVIMYLPEKKPHDVNLNINIHMTGDMRNISFLMSDGNETPLRAIKVGTGA